MPEAPPCTFATCHGAGSTRLVASPLPLLAHSDGARPSRRRKSRAICGWSKKPGRLRALGPRRPRCVTQRVEDPAQADHDGERARRDADDLGEAPLQLALADTGERAQLGERDAAVAREQPLDAALDVGVAAAFAQRDLPADVVAEDRHPLGRGGGGVERGDERVHGVVAMQFGERDAAIGERCHRRAGERPGAGGGEADGDDVGLAARAQHERPRQLAGDEERRLRPPAAVAATLVVGPAAVDDQLGAAVGRNRLLGAVLVRFEGPAAVDVRGECGIGVVLAVARRHCASASSSTSIQCRTGVAVPLCRCWMQPMFAETIAAGSSASRWPSLRSRRRVAMSGCSTEYVPAEPQHRCASLARDAHVEAERRAAPSRRRRAAAGRAAACTADGTPARLGALAAPHLAPPRARGASVGQQLAQVARQRRRCGAPSCA